MVSAAGRWSERQAALLVLEDGEGRIGLGEAAPLPGYSEDTLPEAVAALCKLGAARLSLPPSAPASARAALDAALLDLRARQAGQPAWTLLRPEAEPPLAGGSPARRALSLWLPADSEHALDVARGALTRGVRAFKVKLEPGSEVGIQTLRALRERYGAEITLSADANRSFSRAEISPALPALRELALSWLEEPSFEPLEPALGIPLALDESLQAGDPDFPAARAAGVVALMVKPTTLGGIAACLRLASAAAEHGIRSVASHTLEGPVGFMAAAALALSLGSRVAHGLGPHAGLTGVRPPALDPVRDELLAWTAPGFGLDLRTALSGAEITREVVL
jgi:L-alanine-DL-glutamate epimerase-like enolase superfamily enzyme